MVAYFVVLGVEWLLGIEVFDLPTHETIQFALLPLAAGLLLWRALAVRDDRATWLALGLGVISWLVGQVVATLQAPAGQELPFPSAADIGLLGFYAAQYVAFFLLARSGLRRVPRAAWLDGAIASLLVGAAGAQWV
ncbi:MAG: hypothetical protein QOG77_1672, partial [Solirubrobacteraceae bacterium]|nr:hypothetical protein [Solirubrobacteraceae bacterium]